MSPQSATPRLVRAGALVFGLVNHALFAAAIASMAVALWTGLGIGRGPFCLGPLGGWPAVFADLVLVLQFPLLHSALLTRRGGRCLAGAFKAPHGRALVTTTYASLASVQLLLTFWMWSPSGVVLWQPSGAALLTHTALFVAAWVFLVKAIVDGGLATQTGALGWWAVFRGQAPRYPTFATRGTFALCRQPIYLAFALLLWSAPTWTLDRVLLGSLWSAYCVFGPRLKERRYLAWHGAAYRAYQQRVAYFLPRVHRPS